MRWTVYIIPFGSKAGTMKPLGYVNAPHQPAALAAAWKRWPDEGDERSTQRGFTVRPYRNDPYSLGPQSRRDRGWSK